MQDLCERPTCGRCEGPLLEPIERNTVSWVDSETYVCPDCYLDETTFVVMGDGRELPPMGERIDLSTLDAAPAHRGRETRAAHAVSTPRGARA